MDKITVVRTSARVTVNGVEVLPRNTRMDAKKAGSLMLKAFEASDQLRIDGDTVIPKRWITISGRGAILNANQHYTFDSAATRVVNALASQRMLAVVQREAVTEEPKPDETPKPDDTKTQTPASAGKKPETGTAAKPAETKKGK